MRCIYCGKDIELTKNGWKAEDGYTCWREGAGRMLAEAHEPDETEEEEA